MITRRRARWMAPAVVLVSSALAFGFTSGVTEADEPAAPAIAATGNVTAGPATVAAPEGSAQATDGQQPTGPRRTETSQAASQPQQSRPAGGTSGPLAPPALQASFEGQNIGACCVRPPDTHGAVGLTQFVEVTNGKGVAVFAKSNGVKQKETSFASFFGYTARTIFDPQVVYDKVWNRWVIVAEAFQESSTIQNVFLAASTTSNAAGSYFIYKFDVPEPSGDFFDYPKLGMDQDALIITANIFTGNTYVRSRLLAPPKAAVYNGKGWSAPYFNLGTPGTPAPPIVEDNNTNAYVVAARSTHNTTLTLFRATNLGRSGATVALQANVPVPAWGVPPDGRQPGSANRLDSLDGRFQGASTQIGDQLLNIHTINTNSFPTPKWYQIDTAGAGANTVPAGRSGFVFESGDSDDFNPHVAGSPVGGTAANPIGRMFFTWTATDAVGGGLHQASVKGGGRLASDPVTVSPGSTFTTAGVAYNPSADLIERWGDYSAVSIDPVASGACVAGQRAWIVDERHTSATVWGSRFGRLGFC